ncbi:hypothetical protein MRX96_014177 [Rhipicephalus microplus]
MKIRRRRATLFSSREYTSFDEQKECGDQSGLTEDRSLRTLPSHHSVGRGDPNAGRRRNQSSGATSWLCRPGVRTHGVLSEQPVSGEWPLKRVSAERKGVTDAFPARSPALEGSNEECELVD